MRFLLLFAALLASCSSDNEAAIPLDQPFKVGYAEQRSVDRDALALTFSAVTEDSRCPSDVQCVWAGQATVTLLATADGSNSQELTLTIPTPDTASFAGYSIQLLSLDPYPVAEQPTEAALYEATLVVSQP